MKKSLVAATVGIAMITGSAFAQSTLSDTTTVTHSSTVAPAPAPVDPTFKSKKTEHVIDRNGVETDKSQTYVSGQNGSSASSTVRTTAPDGSVVNESTEGKTVLPNGETTTTSQTVTKER
jgi:hypothetical protein